jgi:OOP family OmpA-OmpF porin
MKFKISLFTAAFMICLSVHAQTPTATTGSSYGLPKGKDYDRFRIGITVGANIFQGDILKKKGDADQDNLSNYALNLSYGIAFNYQVTHTIGLRLRGMMGQFAGEQFFRTDVNGRVDGMQGFDQTRLLDPDPLLNKFQSTYFDGTFDMIYTFGNISHLKRNKKFHFNIMAGVGLINFNSKVEIKDSSESVTLAERKPQNGDTKFIVPIGIGVKYKINRFDVGLEVSYRRAITDDIDATRKASTAYDGYTIVGLNVNYTLGKKQKEMEWVNPMEVVYNDIADLKDKVDVLSGDKDKDGVADMFDKDNSTPEGTKVYGDGTAVDTDNDGVADSKDADPFSPKGAKVDANGVETDSDGDGVPDGRDLEPNTEKGTLVNFQGITIPLNASKSGMSGGYLPSVYFELNKSTIRTNQQDRMVVIARMMKANPDIKIVITGNTDITGSEKTNLSLAQKRADAAKNHLVKHYGIDPSRITTESKGEAEPLAEKLNPMNRRVDFKIAE